MNELYGKTINERKAGTQLHEVTFQPKGTDDIIPVFVWARNRLEAHNILIQQKLFGKQLGVTPCNVNLIQ